jgi:hypothetical protein
MTGYQSRSYQSNLGFVSLVSRPCPAPANDLAESGREHSGQGARSAIALTPWSGAPLSPLWRCVALCGGEKGHDFMMAAIIRQVPGLIGAITAYVVLRLLRWLIGIQSIAGELLILVVIVLVVALIADRAIRKYQQPPL